MPKTLDVDEVQQGLTEEVKGLLNLEKSVQDAEAALSANEQFQNFIKLQKRFNEESGKVWKAVETAMIDNNIKSIKGDFGSITVAERSTWVVEDESKLDEKFFKRVPDTKKISASAELEGEAPAGVTKKITRYLTKRLK